ncbi:malolactic regulator [Paucilactobacillus oligofermentans DSM 15707 = LMG 22743]|uniref:Malolactic regulator n=1 Tax=Paucilactobacillus oligofermentans DSM 15707 = LMG 22743 TaxID=1423778 RepID=A0A0R1RMK7_9LACO|nr:LysR family transcriptional regulator [Paucilactobacillus oligofermentans]KRL54747.1 malolactic regulator [Paucilactobacillus oligofermentans DSM 15707 = LMG 22743]CUS26341.1 Malolactic fermentation system transcriptional activator [Paucilactobacillus oligofermentans DSM 15707 = LMG 22743]
MNTKDLEYFIALAKYKNYTRVAKQFSVSQPSVTQAIHRLEKEFDTHLVHQDRAHQTTLITREGLLLKKNAALIDQYILLAHREIDNAKIKNIRFGLPPIIGMLYFSKIAGKLLKNGMLNSTDIVESGSDELLKQLKNGEIDIALLGSVHPIELNEIDAIHLGERPFVIVTSKYNSLAKLNTVSFKDLGAKKFISLSGRYVHPVAFKAYCEYANINPNIVYETADISWAKSLVKEDIGISMIVEDAIQRQDDIHVIKISDQVPVCFNISVAIRKDYILSDFETEFLDVLKDMTI